MFLVTRWTSPWGRILNYTVVGSTHNYVVNLSLPKHKQSDAVQDAKDSKHDLFPASSGSGGNTSWRPRHQLGPPPSFCSCPAFAYTILLASPDSESSPLMVTQGFYSGVLGYLLMTPILPFLLNTVQAYIGHPPRRAPPENVGKDCG